VLSIDVVFPDTLTVFVKKSIVLDDGFTQDFELIGEQIKPCEPLTFKIPLNLKLSRLNDVLPK